MRKTPLVGILGLAVLATSLQAVVPQKWELRTREDYLRGKFDGISVSYDGMLALAPKEEKIAAPQEEFYLSVLATPDGTIFLGTGHGGKVYRIGKDGKSEVWFQAPEMDVTSLALDRKGVLYASTSPNGRIYKITGSGKGEEFFNPAEKYIWDLLFLNSGELWAAVGENGGIYRISPLGEGRMFFKAAENHILCLEKTAREDVIAGSGGNGLVYKITPEGQVSVLFETPYEEVRSLAMDREGLIYAAASGTPTRSRQDAGPAAPVRLDAEVSITVSASGGDSRPASAAAAGAKDGGALYRLTGDGLAKRLWSSDDEMIYTLLWREDEKKVLFGTGGKGRIYSVDKEERVALLLQQSSEQVYLLAPLDSKVCVLSNNPCYFGRLLSEQRFAGEYTGPVFDARTLASWGRIVWDAAVAAGASVQLQTRSGNTNEPNAMWSEWSPPYGKTEEQILSPRARYLQVKALLRVQTGRASPVLDRVTVFYLQSNIAPSVARPEFLRPNEVYLKLPEPDDVILGVERNLPEASAKKDELRIGMPARKAERKGFQTVVWDAADENGDTLRYGLAMKKDGESEWRVLEEGLTESIYAFDTLSFPDGTYLLRLTASDAASNPLGLELKSERTSPPLVIDNSLPAVKNFTAARNGAALDISFQAEDAYSYIEEAKVLVRPGEWRVVFPVDGMADSRSESFKFSVKLPPGAENQVTVRVRDSYGNVGVFRQNF
jgi:outer membrane protein assembly factor BamB